jgi:hypothetical protein
MAERSFEHELSRLFAEAEPLPDADLFALRVDEKLRRGWTLRRALIGGLGVAGGVIGGAQLLGGGFMDRFGETTAASGRLLTGKLIDLVEDSVMPQSFPWVNDVVWAAGTLAIVGVIYAVTRVVREF